MNQEITCLSGHPFSELQEALDFINNEQLSIELFDAFLMEYANSRNLDEAINFARAEWDC